MPHKYSWRLRPEDHQIIKSRLIEGDTYQKIATDYSVSRERIRQIAKLNNLQGVGLKKRSEVVHKEWLTKMGKTYGEFFNGSQVTERDLLTECKDKYRAKKYNSIREGIDFTIEFQDITWNKYCPILGIEIDYYAEGRQENSPSFDRFDPSKGYIKGNVTIVSWRANRLKNDGTAEEHLSIYRFMTKLACQDSI